MPQLRILGRRWRLASDMLPFLGLIFVTLHVAIICPVFIVFVAGTGGYECPEETLVYASILSTLGINLLAMVHDGAMVLAGWRGGPLEEHKRKYMPALVISRIVLLILSFGCLIFSTVLIYSPSIMRNCYAGDPCSKIPGACEDGRLTESCNVLYKSSVNEIISCRNQWFNLAATYAVNMYNASAEPHYVGFVGNGAQTNSSCNATIQADGDAFLAWQNETGEYFEKYNPTALPGSLDDESRPIGVAWGQEMGFPNGSVVPWNGCLSKSCYTLVNSATACIPYNDLIFFGDHSVEYSYALAAIWGSWALLLLLVLIFILAYNAFPDYQEQDSWVKTVKTTARLCCFYSILKHTKTEEGEDAAVGLGGLLFKLFGGIDLDQTDVLLGLYLVSERQNWRRFVTAKYRIESTGKYRYIPKPGKLQRCFPSSRQGRVDTNDIMMGHIFTLAGQSDELEDFEDSVSLSMEYSVMTFENSMQNNSPMQSADSIDSPYQAPQLVNVDNRSRRLHSRKIESLTRGHNIVFSRDRKPYLTPFKFLNGCFEPLLEPESAVDMCFGSKTEQVPVIILEQCRRLCWFAKASYGLQTVKWKDGKTGKWHHDTIDSCLGCLHTLGAKVVVKNHFRKRNLDAIIRYTDANPSDILHVSYTDTALGIIPYLVILDRKSRSIVISIRGTVETADVITDLLSHPQDCSSSLPLWVLEKLDQMNKGDAAQQDHVDGKIYCHRGILSSAKAILNDLDSKNILSAMENVETRTGKYQDDILEALDNTMDHQNEHIETLRQDEDVHLPIHRAQSIVHEAAGKGWDLIVTGHSLGAAVASLISFNLRERFPGMKCFAFNPPGGVMDPRLSEISKTFCTSVIVGMDLISRLSTGNMSALIDDLVLALGRCKRPKLSIFFDALFGRRHDPATTPPTYYSPEEISPEVQRMLLLYLKTSTVHMDIKDAKLYPPGNLIFLRPMFNLVNQKKPPAWDAVYIDKKDLMEEGILLTREALEHHHLWTTLEALEDSIQRSAGSIDDSCQV